MTEPEEKIYNIHEAARYLGYTQQYVRILARRGVLKSTRVPVSEGSKVTKHTFTEENLAAAKSRPNRRTTRSDGRNKFIAYLRPDELEAIRALLDDNGLEEANSLLSHANKKNP